MTPVVSGYDVICWNILFVEHQWVSSSVDGGSLADTAHAGAAAEGAFQYDILRAEHPNPSLFPRKAGLAEFLLQPLYGGQAISPSYT